MADHPRKIDVHHHVLPPVYKERAREQIIAGTGQDPATLFNWTPESALTQMDQHGIETAIASISTPGIWFGDNTAAASLAHDCNDFMAGMKRQHPKRFGFFAAIPLPDTAASIKEIGRALDELGADGIGILTSYRDRWPGDPAFDAVFAELNRRKAVVFVHPTCPACCLGIIPGIHAALTEFVFDTTRAVTSLLANGTFTRYPEIRFIFCHAGGTLMPISSRVTSLERIPQFKDALPNGVLHELKRLYYDTATSFTPPSMAALRALVPLSQILFGTDNPYVPVAATATSFDAFGLTAEEAAAIGRDNALRLFPRLRG